MGIEIREQVAGEAAETAQMGITIHAEEIPTGSEKMWELLNRAYGAVAVFIRGNTSASYFPNIEAGWNFSYMIEDAMPAPEITDRSMETRETYEEKVEFLGYGMRGR